MTRVVHLGNGVDWSVILAGDDTLDNGDVKAWWHVRGTAPEAMRTHL
jgi:hypothetical protein